MEFNPKKELFKYRLFGFDPFYIIPVENHFFFKLMILRTTWLDSISVMSWTANPFRAVRFRLQPSKTSDMIRNHAQ